MKTRTAQGGLKPDNYMKRFPYFLKHLTYRFNFIHATAQLCVPDSFKQIGGAPDAAEGRVGGDDFVIGGQHDVAIHEGFL